jgi:hypothetical protein
MNCKIRRYIYVYLDTTHAFHSSRDTCDTQNGNDVWMLAVAWRQGSENGKQRKMEVSCDFGCLEDERGILG